MLRRKVADPVALAEARGIEQLAAQQIAQFTETLGERRADPTPARWLEHTLATSPVSLPSVTNRPNASAAPAKPAATPSRPRTSPPSSGRDRSGPASSARGTSPRETSSGSEHAGA